MTRPGLGALISAVVLAAAASTACGRAEGPGEAAHAPAAVTPEAPPAKPKQAERVGSSRTTVDDMDLATAEKAIADASKELGNALALATPDCATLRPLRDRICELSEHICRLAGLDPEIKARCDDGRRRCSDAKDRVASQCP